MATAIDDLWPADIATAEEVVAPVTILRQQASLLGQRTKNLIEAVVETESTNHERVMRHTFTLVVPALSFYRYTLFYVEHPATQLYPLRFDPHTVPPVVDDVARDAADPYPPFDVADENEFKQALRRVFADEETKRIIGALIAQSVANGPVTPF
jgi:hypothetical protein